MNKTEKASAVVVCAMGVAGYARLVYLVWTQGNVVPGSLECWIDCVIWLLIVSFAVCMFMAALPSNMYPTQTRKPDSDAALAKEPPRG